MASNYVKCYETLLEQSAGRPKLRSVAAG